MKQLPVEGENLRAFQGVLRKYGVAFSIMRDRQNGKKRYLTFFKAKDEAVLTKVLAECTRRQLDTREEKKPSILAALAKMKEKVAARPKRHSRMKEKDLTL